MLNKQPYLGKLHTPTSKWYYICLILVPFMLVNLFLSLCSWYVPIHYVFNFNPFDDYHTHMVILGVGIFMWIFTVITGVIHVYLKWRSMRYIDKFIK